MELKLKPEVEAAVGVVKGAQVRAALERLPKLAGNEAWLSYTQLCGALCERPETKKEEDED